MAQIFPLSEGSFTVGHDKHFVPFNLDQDILTDRTTGSLLVEVQPFLVVTAKDVIIFDSGLGFHNAEGVPQIHENIRQHGYEPGQVTKVLLSHLHKDHAGGLVYMSDNGVINTTFPNADYYIYRAEADYALQHNGSSYVASDFEPLLATTQVKWLDGEQGDIDGYIHFTHSGGHCPQHIVFLINDDGDKVFYGGDEAPQLKQMIMKYIAKYDNDGKKAMELRAQYLEEGKREGWQFLFYHDIKTPVNRF